MARIFISYAREDYEIAKHLYDFLISQGQEPWLDKENLLPGQKWESAIQSAIRESQFFIALLSPNSIEKRGYIQKELRIGLDILDQIPESQIFFIPVRIGECQPRHERLRELQWVDLFPKWKDGLNRLMRVFTFVPNQMLTPTLIDTEWQINTSIGLEQTVIFRDGGIIERNKNKKRASNGTWSQSGNIVYMQINQNYVQYKGIITGNKITGEAQNIEGGEWTWEAIKLKKSS